MNQNIIDFYQKVRADDVLIGAFSNTQTADEMADVAVAEGSKLGFHFSKEEAKAAGSDIDSLRANVMNDDELNDFELELISAGVVSKEGKHDPML